MNRKFSRQLQLFKLFSEEKDYRSAKFFGDLLSVSAKTIYNDMSELNEAMGSFHLIIDKKPRFGLLLIGSEENKLRFEQYLLSMNDEQATYFSTEDRYIDIICLLLRSSGEGIAAEVFEEKYFISDSTLRTDLEQIREKTYSKAPVFERIKGKICLKGDEATIQRIWKNYLMEHFPSYGSELVDRGKLELFFSEAEIRFANESLNHVLRLSNAQISDYYMNSLLFFFLVFGIRINKGFHHQQHLLNKEDLSLLETYFISHELADWYLKEANLVLTLDDVQAINEQLFANGIYLTVLPEKIDPFMEKTVDNILKNLGNLIKVTISDDVELKRALMAHIPPMIFRLRRNIRLENPLLKEIKKQYLLLFSLLWYVLSDLEEKYDIRLNDDEISFILIYFQVSLEKRHGVYFKNIVIVCPKGLSTSELLYTKIRAIIPIRDRIITKTLDELQEMNLQDIDFIVSTVSLKHVSIPTVYVSPLLTNNDVVKIMDEYAKQDDKYKSMTLTSKSTFYKNIDSFIDEKFIFCKKDFTNKSECLDYLIDIYEREQVTTARFRQSVYDREEMGDTSVYTGVGIPHAAPETVLQTKISFVSLKKPIKWGANEVDFIVLLAVSNQDVDLAREIIKKIFQMAEDKKALKEIRAANKKLHLMSFIRNEVFKKFE